MNECQLTKKNHTYKKILEKKLENILRNYYTVPLTERDIKMKSTLTLAWLSEHVESDFYEVIEEKCKRPNEPMSQQPYLLDLLAVMPFKLLMQLLAENGSRGMITGMGERIIEQLELVTRENLYILLGDQEESEQLTQLTERSKKVFDTMVQWHRRVSDRQTTGSIRDELTPPYKEMVNDVESLLLEGSRQEYLNKIKRKLAELMVNDFADIGDYLESFHAVIFTWFDYCNYQAMWSKRDVCTEQQVLNGFCMHVWKACVKDFHIRENIYPGKRVKLDHLDAAFKDFLLNTFKHTKNLTD